MTYRVKSCSGAASRHFLAWFIQLMCYLKSTEQFLNESIKDHVKSERATAHPDAMFFLSSVMQIWVKPSVALGHSLFIIHLNWLYDSLKEWHPILVVQWHFSSQWLSKCPGPRCPVKSAELPCISHWSILAMDVCDGSSKLTDLNLYVHD